MPEGATTTQTPTDDTIRAQVAELVRKADRNPHRVAKTLLGRISDLEKKLETAVPAGAIVLTGDDAKAYEAYKTLGKPDELKTKLGKVDELQTTLAQRDARDARRKVAREGAPALGYNPDALETLADDKGLELELREAEVDDGKGGKVKKQIPHVVTTIGTGDRAEKKYEPLDVVAKRDFPVYLPALTASSDGDGDRRSSGASRSGGSSGAPAMPPSPRTTGAQGDDVTEDEMKATRAMVRARF